MVGPKAIIRTTLDKVDCLPRVGIYIIAYMGAILYVGKAGTSIFSRLAEHMYTMDPIGAWLRMAQPDAENVRVDGLEAPDDDVRWLRAAEAALIRRFKPLFNVQLQGEAEARPVS